jgi:UDP-glucose 4-epimerase
MNSPVAGLKGKRVLLTGGTGFLGANLLRRLTSSGVHPVATYRDRPPLPADASVEWMKLDLAVAGAVRSLVGEVRPDVVFHLAAKLGSDRSYEFADEVVSVNLVGTHSLLSALGRCCRNLERVVIVGTSEEYGRCERLPITEEQPARPVSPYSASKAAATQLATLYHTLFGCPVVILRPFIVYGPGQPPRMMIPELIRCALDGRDFEMTKGEQTRDFVYVDDVTECLVLAATASGVDGEIFNVCSGEERPIREVAELVLRLTGATVKLLPGAKPYRENEVWRLAGSNLKSRTLLGWAPRTPLEEGLQKTIAYYREQLKIRSI